jgi:4a-hydroxytetrahydrobiopterin dehydratase
MSRKKIGASAALAQLKGWKPVEGRDAIQKSFRFADFKTAFAFMTRVALKAEQLDHHPEWFNVYSRVDVLLTTHDADGVTALDVELAAYCDAAAGKQPKPPAKAKAAKATPKKK